MGVIEIGLGDPYTLDSDIADIIWVHDGGEVNLLDGGLAQTMEVYLGASLNISGCHRTLGAESQWIRVFESAIVTLKADSIASVSPVPTDGVIAAPFTGTLFWEHEGIAYELGISTGEDIAVEIVAGSIANAGEDVYIDSVDQQVTVIEGLATGASFYRWLKEGAVLLDWTEVGGGAANLALGALDTALPLGAHTLTLEIGEPESDGYAMTASDTMTLTIQNTPPDASVSEDQTVQINLDLIVVSASLMDFDGDTLSYEWRKGGEVLDFGSVSAPAGGDPVAIDDLLVSPGDPRFPLGENIVELVVDDGVNEAANFAAVVNVVDTMAPTLCPVPSRRILWPPNHKLLPVTVWANAFDNGGGALTLDVTVESSQPAEPGETDYYIDSVDDDTGVIELRLRSEREGKGFGRVYKVTVTATDESGNQSSAVVRILCPRRGWRRWRNWR